MSQKKIDRGSIVIAALAALDEVGVDGLSMRVLAQRLSVQAPTIYWHFPSKDALLDAMADAIIAPAQDGPMVVDRASFMTLAHALRAALLRYRDGARVFAGRYEMSENVLSLAERWLAFFLSSGVEPARAAHLTLNLASYIVGFCIEEQGFQQKWGEGPPPEEDSARLRALAAERFPALFRVTDTILDGSFDERFDIALEMYLSATSVPKGA